jgi:hypothetical protein
VSDVAGVLVLALAEQLAQIQRGGFNVWTNSASHLTQLPVVMLVARFERGQLNLLGFMPFLILNNL